MKSFNLKPSSFGFLVGTRAALTFAAGLLVARFNRAFPGSGFVRPM